METGIKTQNPSDYQRRAGFVKSVLSPPCEPLRRARCKPIIPLRTVAASTTKTNHPPCEPLRFARCFSPPSCSPQRLAGVGEYKSDEAHAALVAARLLRADQRRLRFLPLGVASHDARPRGSETVRARCGVDAWGIDGRGMLFHARLLFRARFGAQTQRSWISAGMGWAGALPLHPRSGRCPENLQGDLSP